MAALAGIFFIAHCIAAVLVCAALAAQWPLQCWITLATLVEAHTRVQYRFDDGYVVAFCKAAVGVGGWAILGAVGAVREPCVGASGALCGDRQKERRCSRS